MKAKYIITNNGDIIIFSPGLNHSDFKEFNPVRAGFIEFDLDIQGGEITCNCFGESISLGLKSDTGKDTVIAERHILGYYF